MGIREKLNENPPIAMGLAGFGILLIVIVAYFTFRTPRPDVASTQIPDKTFFSDDDGKSFYVDDSSNIPPYDHGGRKAYRAALFLDTNDQKFVGFLESYDPDVKAKIEAAIKGGQRPVVAYEQYIPNIKKPGEKAWAKPKENGAPTAEFLRVITPKPPTKNATTKSARLVVLKEDIK